MTNFDKAMNTDLALKLVFFAFLATLAVFLACELKILIVSLLLAITLASALTPVAETLEKRGISRLAGVIAVYLLGIACYAVIAVLLLPSVCEQWSKLNDSLPAYLSSLSGWYQSALRLTGSSSDALVTVQNIRELVIRLLHQSLDMTAGFVGLVLNTILTLFLAAYFVVDADKIWAALFSCLPPHLRPRIDTLILPLASRMGGYVRGQLLVAFCVALFLATGFSLLGIRYALVLGLLAGLLNLVPYIGSLLACILAVMVAFNQSIMLAGAVLLLYAIEQWVETAFLVPYFLGKHTSLHPLIVLLAIIIGAGIMGVPGALVSVPVASAALYLLQELWIKRFNEDETRDKVT